MDELHKADAVFKENLLEFIEVSPEAKIIAAQVLIAKENNAEAETLLRQAINE